MTENNEISANIQGLDNQMVEDIQKAIQKAVDDNKPKFANVAVANFDGSIAYTLTKKIGREKRREKVLRCKWQSKHWKNSKCTSRVACV